MRVFDFYKDFVCIAGECRHSCCRGGWEVDIDEETAALYRFSDNPFADCLRKKLEIIEEDGEEITTLRLENGQCPFFNERGLCDIILNMGEEAISLVCTEYPRYTQRMGCHTERTLSLSCEEVGRLLFSKKDKLKMVEANSASAPSFKETMEKGWQEIEKERKTISYDSRDIREKSANEKETKKAVDIHSGILDETDEIDGDLLEKIRQGALDILQNRQLDMNARLAAYLDFCEKVQSYVNQFEEIEDGEDRLRDFLAGYDLSKSEGEIGIDGKIPEDFQKRENGITGKIPEDFQKGEIGIDGKIPEELQKGETGIDGKIPEELQKGEPGKAGEKWSETETACREAFEERLGMLQMMTVLDEEWQQVMTAFEETAEAPEAYLQALKERALIKKPDRELYAEHLMAYFTYRYFPRALQDGNILGKAQFSVLSLLVIRDMTLLKPEENIIDISRIYSREVEHADDNVDILMEELLFSDTLASVSVETLLGVGL